MYHFVYCMNTLLTTGSRRYSRFKSREKRSRCHPFMALNRAADWRSQVHVKNYRNCSRVKIRFFSVVEIPIKHSSLHIITW